METIEFKPKKAQEEMFGFILVVVIITIIGLGFLLLINPKQIENKNSQLDNLLYSVVSYNYGDANMKALLEECSGNSIGCDKAKKTLQEIMSKALDKGSLSVGKQLQGYNLSVTNMPDITEGNLTGNKIGSFIPISETTIVKLEFYY